MQEMRVRSLGWKDALDKEMTTHSSVLAWRIPWTEESGRLQSMGLQKSQAWLSDQHTQLFPGRSGVKTQVVFHLLVLSLLPYVTFPVLFQILDCFYFKSIRKVDNINTNCIGVNGRNPLEKGMATHSSILAWRIPWTEKPGGLQSVRSQREGHDWATNTHKKSINLPWNSFKY